jgi:hypothetical protein
LVAGRLADAAVPRDMLGEAHALDLVRAKLRWLAAVRDCARDLADRGPLGLFGTSIATAWLVAELGPRVRFLVDEDPQRTGREFMGLPVYAPTQAPAGTDVLIPLPIEVAEHVYRRIGNAGLPARFHLPQPRGVNRRPEPAARPTG